MKALIVEISFFEAFFKVHYTKGFRLTYPIPLPTTVAGMFGAFLGIERDELAKEFGEMLFGAKLVNYDGMISENATYLQYKARPVKGTAPLLIINNPTYLIAIASDEKKIEYVKERLNESVEYLPYGGQNDFFVKDWKILGIEDVTKSNEITNYAPQDWVKNIVPDEGSEIQILPVMHKISENPNFYFVANGMLKLKENIPCVKKEKIGLYRLKEFQIIE